MLRRTEFKRKPPAAYAKPERAPQPLYALTRPFNGVVITGEVNGQPKENAVYSEPYRRLVAALPCIECSIEGYSQAAHPPPTGKSRKEDDRKSFPLCCPHPVNGVLVNGCHFDFDQYRSRSRDGADQAAIRNGVQTRATIRLMGLWPKGLPHMEEQLELESLT